MRKAVEYFKSVLEMRREDKEFSVITNVVFLVGLSIGVCYMFEMMQRFSSLSPEKLVYASFLSFLTGLFVYSLLIALFYVVYRLLTPSSISTYKDTLDCLYAGNCGSIVAEIGAVIGLLIPFVAAFTIGIAVGMCPLTIALFCGVITYYILKEA